jgi:hypothetical protein
LYGDKRKAVGRIEPTEEGNFLHKLSIEYLIELGEKFKNYPDKKKFVFTDLINGKQLRNNLFSHKYEPVSCTIPLHKKKTTDKSNKELLTFFVKEVVERRNGK